MSFFADAGGGDYVKFDDTTMGQPIEMEIAGPYKERVSKYKGEVRLKKDGSPQIEAVIPVLIDGELHQLVVNKWRMQSAIGSAVKITGASELEIGGKLTVVFTGKEQSKYGGTAQKFSASYKRGDGGPATPRTVTDFNESADQAVNLANNVDPYAGIPGPSEAPAASPWDRV